MLILVLESSTSSAKAMLYDTDSGAIETRAAAFRTAGPVPGTHLAEDVFQDMASLGRGLAAGKDVAAIALSCAWHSVMLCDSDMQPLTPVYLWTNTDASALCDDLRRDAGFTTAYYHQTGCMVNAIYPFFKLKYLASSGYRLSDYRIMGQGTYNTWRLTGAWVVTDAVASGSGLLDIHTLSFDPALLGELGITASHLGEPVTWRDTLPLSEEGAALLGLAPGIPVIASMPDGALNQAGSGAMGEGLMSLSLGTSGALRLAVSRPVIPESPSLWCYRGPDRWLSGAATSGCCNCVDWFSRALGAGAGLAELDAMAARVTGETPVFLPFLFGERCPGWDDGRRGGFLHLKPSHSMGDMYRGVLEGVLFNLYQCYEALCRVNGAPHTIRLSGGITHSPFWMQMCADVFDRIMLQDATAHASMMGGVNLARHMLGLLRDLGEVEAQSGVQIVPDPGATEVYRQKYARYLDCYGSRQDARHA